MITSFETSVKLRDAGFPQPDVSPGQYWWNLEQQLFYVVDVNMSIVYYHRFKSINVFEGTRDLFEKRVFAANPTDILRNEDGIKLWSFKGIWTAYDPNNDLYFSHENPAEACAPAFLEKNKKCIVERIPYSHTITCTGPIELPDPK